MPLHDLAPFYLQPAGVVLPTQDLARASIVAPAVAADSIDEMCAAYAMAQHNGASERACMAYALAALRNTAKPQIAHGPGADRYNGRFWKKFDRAVLAILDEGRPPETNP